MLKRMRSAPEQIFRKRREAEVRRCQSADRPGTL